MNYRHIRNVRPKGRFFDLGLPLIFIVLAVLFHFLYPSFLGEAVSRIASPFWQAERFLSEKAGGLLFFFSSKESLAEDVERLSLELKGAHRLLLDRDLLIEENRLLREQLGRTEVKEGRLVGAILATPPRSPYDTAALDIGSDEGVAVGDLALAGSTVLGTVSRVSRTTSLVEFFSTAGTKTPVSILHEGRAVPVEAMGLGGGEFSATLPKEVLVGEGDAIVMPGFNPFLFAQVEAIETSPTDSFQKIRFKNPVPVSSLRFLELEKAPQSYESR